MRALARGRVKRCEDAVESGVETLGRSAVDLSGRASNERATMTDSNFGLDCGDNDDCVEAP